MFGPVRATCVLPLKSLEVFSAQGHTGSLGESDIELREIVIQAIYRP
jgi:hypothetical protein